MSDTPITRRIKLALKALLFITLLAATYMFGYAVGFGHGKHTAHTEFMRHHLPDSPQKK